jgi:hypothetical protein
MSDTVVSVSYERKFSDGNYGSEGLSLSWTVTYEDDSDYACDAQIVEARCTEIASKLRVAVLQELGKSRAHRVSWAARSELLPPDEVRPAATAAALDSHGNTQDLEDLPF